MNDLLTQRIVTGYLHRTPSTPNVAAPTVTVEAPHPAPLEPLEQIDQRESANRPAPAPRYGGRVDAGGRPHPQLQQANAGAASHCGPPREWTTNAPLERGPLSERALSVQAMASAFYDHDPSALAVNDESIKHFMEPISGGADAWLSLPTLERVVENFHGHPGAYAFMARAAELGSPRAKAMVAEYLKHHQPNYLGLGVYTTASVGTDPRQVPGAHSGPFAREASVRGYARLVRAAHLPADAVGVMDPIQGRVVPLSKDTYFPGARRAVPPPPPMIEARPLGDVATAKTSEDILAQRRSKAYLCFSDRALRSYLNGLRPGDLREMWRESKGEPRRYEFMARTTELWMTEPGIDQRQEAFRPTLAARSFLRSELPQTPLCDAEIPGILRLAKAADVDVELLSYRGRCGTPERLVTHPGYLTLLEHHR